MNTVSSKTVEINVAFFLKASHLVLIKKATSETLGILRGNIGRVVPNGLETAVTPPFGLATRREVNVGTAVLDAKFQIFIYVI